MFKLTRAQQKLTLEMEVHLMCCVEVQGMYGKIVQGPSGTDRRTLEKLVELGILNRDAFGAFIEYTQGPNFRDAVESITDNDRLYLEGYYA